MNEISIGAIPRKVSYFCQKKVELFFLKIKTSEIPRLVNFVGNDPCIYTHNNIEATYLSERLLFISAEKSAR